MNKHLRCLSIITEGKDLAHGKITLPAFADQYDDCVKGCNEGLTICINQVRLSAGNVQEEQDLNAACEKNKADCSKACSAAEVAPETPSQTPPEEQPQSR